MADKDTVTKEYMQDNAVFADAFNFYCYGGRQVIDPDQLKSIDTTAIALPYGNSETVPVQKYRDVLKVATAKADKNAAYLLLGIENQSQMHYAMPVRNMLYDAIQYASQVDEASKAHRKDSDSAETQAEFLSGFYKTDKLLPVITLTVYFGADKWEAPTDLHGMLSADIEILKFVDNYHLHLIAPADISDDDFGRFHTELRAALKYVKYSKDKKRLDEVLHEDSTYQRISRKTADMINIVTGSKLKYNPGEERVDMCKAIEDMRNDAIREGMEKGLEQGIEKGIEQGIEKGIEQGIEKGIEQGLQQGIEQGIEKGIEQGLQQGIMKTLAGLVKDGILTISDAAKRAGMTVPEFQEKAELTS